MGLSAGLLVEDLYLSLSLLQDDERMQLARDAYRIYTAKFSPTWVLVNSRSTHSDATQYHLLAALFRCRIDKEGHFIGLVWSGFPTPCAGRAASSPHFWPPRFLLLPLALSSPSVNCLALTPLSSQASKVACNRQDGRGTSGMRL